MSDISLRFDNFNSKCDCAGDPAVPGVKMIQE